MAHRPHWCLPSLCLLVAATCAPADTLAGRVVGTVWVASSDVSCGRKADCPKTLDAGLAQLTLGLVWHIKRYANEQNLQQREQYAFAEEEARAERAGLWGDVNPVPPWEWRKTRQ